MSRLIAPVAIVFALALTGCNGNKEGAQVNGSVPGDATTARQSGSTGAVVETMDSGGYTYALIDIGSENVWTAGPVTPLSIGQEVGFAPSMPMQNFHSSTLDRTFDVIYFVSAFTAAGGEAAMPSGHPTVGGPAHPDASDQDFSGITPPTDGHTVGAVWADRASLSGKPVKIRGRVVKFLSGVMGTNWIHVQDGTGEAGTNDLTVTTDATVAVGDQVLVEGTLLTDKDFGAGYRYDVIVEKASVTVE